jgi:hypothetical protein
MVVQRAWMTVRRAPVASSAAGFALIGLAAMTFWTTRPGPAETVLRAVPNDSSGRIEMVGRSGRMLWSIPSGTFHPELLGVMRGEVHAKVVDLNRDGSNEVVTIIPPGNVSMANNAMVRAFRSDGSELWRWELTQRVATVYDSTRFFFAWRPRCIEVYQEPQSGQWRIMAVFVHQHSPSFIVRVDDRGRELGQLWSYGHLGTLGARDLNGDGRVEVITYGLDDATGGAHITVLDPDRVTGVSRSMRSPGYDLPMTTAELRVTMVPSLPVQKGYAMRLAFFRMTLGDVREVALAWGTTEAQSQEFATFVVDSTLEVVSVTPSDGYVDFAKVNAHKRPDLQTKKGLSGWFLQNLKVWNGERWTIKAD